MTIDIGVGWAVAVLLLSLRIGPIFTLAAPFSQITIPMRVRACLVLSLCACLAQPVSATIYQNGATLLLAAGSEVLIGLMLSFGFQVAAAALSFAGRALDVQAGYGLAMVIDSGSKSQTPLFGMMLTLVASLIFFSTNGHIELLRLMARLMQLLPLGQVVLLGSPHAFLNYFGIVMGMGLSAVAATMLVLFLVDITIAFLSRTLPQMNALMLGLQIKVIVTLVMLALSTGLILPVVLRLFNVALSFMPSLVPVSQVSEVG